MQQLTGFSKAEHLNPSLNEKRVMSAYKPIKLGHLKDFPQDFSDYFKDHFGFRNFLISTNNFIKTIHFKVSAKKEVIIGNEGWMFYDNAGSIADHLGKNKLNEEQLELIKDKLLAKKKSCEAQGAKFYLAFFPDKMSIYDEHLPSKYEFVSSTRWDQLISYLKDYDVEVIDSRAEFRSQKGTQLYQKSDSHWNHNGGYLAHKNIISHLRKDFPHLLAPHEKEAYNIRVEEHPQGGDLAMLLGVKNDLTSTWFNYELKNDPKPKQSDIHPEYQFYKEEYRNTFGFKKAIDAPKLLTFNDSYISYIYPFLGDYFSESHFFWTYDFREDLIQKEKPDIVLYMLVERQIEVLMK